MVAHKLSRSVELPGRVLADLDYVQPVTTAQCGRRLLDGCLVHCLPGGDERKLPALIHYAGLAVLNTRHVTHCLLQCLQLDPHATDLDLPVRSAVVMDASMCVDGGHVARAVGPAQARNLHKLARGLGLVVQIPARKADAKSEECTPLTRWQWLQSLGIQHEIAVCWQVPADGDLVPRPDLAARADHGDLRRPVDVEELPARRPDVYDVLPERLTTTVQQPQERQRRARDVCARAGHGAQQRGHDAGTGDATIREPLQQVRARALRHVGHNNACAPLVQGPIDLHNMVVEGHGCHLRKAVDAAQADEVAPDAHEVAGRAVLDHHGFGLARGTAGENDVA
mmetsp:Transcript_53683/g.152981  ORF Transcript_53683/g.152981 Transcript_53683/m.152981 type:complete len:339 (+) Transcript_53683:2019-3035(+)